MSQEADEESHVMAVSEGDDRTTLEADADHSGIGIPENMYLAFFGGCLIGGILVLTIALILRKHARNKQWKEE